jgi:hypothetical protein
LYTCRYLHSSYIGYDKCEWEEELLLSPSFLTLLLVAIAAKALIIQVAIREHENHCMTLLYLNLSFMLVMDDGWYELSWILYVLVKNTYEVDVVWNEYVLYVLVWAICNVKYVSCEWCMCYVWMDICYMYVVCVNWMRKWENRMLVCCSTRITPTGYGQADGS